MLDAKRTALTYRYERWRAISSGILETAGGTFLLLIAVRWYDAGSLAKALVAGGGSVGLMLGPWLVARVETAADIAGGLLKAKLWAGPGGIVCAAGSLYMIGEVRQLVVG